MNKYSFIIPVYNRGDELDELLETLVMQSFNNFDVVVVDDGSDQPCKHVVDKYSDKLSIKYIYQENKGPGMARNRALELSNSEWFIFLDSDCLLPNNYLEIVNQQVISQDFDCFGGPDKAHKDFNTVQKSIGYAMSSILTTGGIRGGKENLDKFYPRSFNLGVKRTAFKEINGFSEMRFGEDLDFSMRLLAAGYTTKLLKEAFVYHKRRNTFKSFFKQVFNSGVARINLEFRHPKTLKFVHTLPSLFVLGSIFLLIFSFFVFEAALLFPFIWAVIFFDALLYTKEIKTAIIA